MRMTQILLVEDNADMRMLLRETLEWANHTVLVGRTGQEALQALNTANPLPQVIVSDLTMPRMDGVTLFEAVRSDVRFGEVRFIIMTANVHDERLTADVIARLDGVLPKPFRVEDLEAMLTR
jgi:two-component system, chemotaxis family, chemotaxis protein CheY